MKIHLKLFVILLSFWWKTYNNVNDLLIISYSTVCETSNVPACVFVCVLCERGNAFQWVFPLPGPAVCEWVWHQIRSPLCSDAELSMACMPAPICTFLLTFHKRLISHAVCVTRLHITHIPTQAEMHRANWINTCTKGSERVCVVRSKSSWPCENHCLPPSLPVLPFTCQSNHRAWLSTDDLAHISNFL